MKILPEQLDEHERSQIAMGYGIPVNRWCLIFENEIEAEEYKQLLENLMKEKSQEIQ